MGRRSAAARLSSTSPRAMPLLLALACAACQGELESGNPLFACPSGGLGRWDRIPELPAYTSCGQFLLVSSRCGVALAGGALLVMGMIADYDQVYGDDADASGNTVWGRGAS